MHKLLFVVFLLFASVFGNDARSKEDGTGMVQPPDVEWSIVECHNYTSAVLHAEQTGGKIPQGLERERPIDPRIDPRLVATLLEWIGKHTAYDVSVAVSKPPTISICQLGESVDYENRSLVVERPVVAIYNIEKGHIFLVAPWDPDNAHSIGTLLHELIHHVQHLSKSWSCWGRAEWEAYKLQEKWLAEHGVKPKFDSADVFLRTRCRRNVHP